MVASINEINNVTSFQFEMKQNISETESNWHF